LYASGVGEVKSLTKSDHTKRAGRIVELQKFTPGKD
jgi:hypothetical protein